MKTSILREIALGTMRDGRHTVFYAKGSAVCYRQACSALSEDSQDAPEKVLLYAVPQLIGGQPFTASQVALLEAAFHNGEREVSDAALALVGDDEELARHRSHLIPA